MKHLPLLATILLSSCCTVTGPAINAASKLGDASADAPIAVQVALYPLQLVSMAVITPMFLVCWMLEDQG